MSWSTLSVRAPETLKDVRKGISPSLETTGLADIQTRIASANSSVSLARNPLSGLSAVVNDLQAQAEDLLSFGGRVLCVHPYLHPVGDRRGDFSYLTAADCIKHLAAKFADVVDCAASDSAAQLGAVCVLLSAHDHAMFSSKLSAFNAVFPVTELQLAQRRARWLHTLHSDKFVIPPSPIWPEWTRPDCRVHKTVSTLDTSISALLAVAAGYDADNTSPCDELADVIDQKVDQISTLSAAWDALSISLSGGDAKVLHLEGSAGAIHRKLLTSELGIAGDKLCAAVCWTGAPERVALFKELWNV